MPPTQPVYRILDERGLLRWARGGAVDEAVVHGKEDRSVGLLGEGEMEGIQASQSEVLVQACAAPRGLGWFHHQGCKCEQGQGVLALPWIAILENFILKEAAANPFQLARGYCIEDLRDG